MPIIYPPPGRRDPSPGLNHEYYSPSANAPFDASPPHPAGSPPRRHKSERHRRRPSPGLSADDDFRPRHGRSRREPSPGYVPGGRRPRSPPIYHVPDPPRQETRREPPHHSHHERDGYPRDARDPRGSYDRDRHARGYPPPEPRDRHHRSSRRDPSPEYRPRRSRPASPEPKPRPRGYTQPLHDDRDGPDPRSSRRSRKEGRSRDPPPPPPEYDSDDDYNRRRRRHRSHPRAAGAEPPRTRSRGAPPANRSPPRRHSSMPATTKAGNAWWKNPMIQAGARTALTVGAQAMMQNRKEEGPWLGSKGVKVATTALSAAFADGLAGGGDGGGRRKR